MQPRGVARALRPPACSQGSVRSSSSRIMIRAVVRARVRARARVRVRARVKVRVRVRVRVRGGLAPAGRGLRDGAAATRSRRGGLLRFGLVSRVRSVLRFGLGSGFCATGEVGAKDRVEAKG